MKRQNFNKTFLKKLMSDNDGYLLYLLLEKQYRYGIVCGWMTSGFKKRSRNDVGRHTLFLFSKISPIVGNTYRVRISNSYFTAKFVGKVLLRESISGFLGFSNKRDHDEVFVFEQNGEYLFYYKDYTEFLREVE